MARKGQPRGEAAWRRALQQCEAQGGFQNFAEYCRKRGWPYATAKAWRSKLGFLKKAAEASRSKPEIGPREQEGQEAKASQGEQIQPSPGKSSSLPRLKRQGRPPKTLSWSTLFLEFCKGGMSLEEFAAQKGMDPKDSAFQVSTQGWEEKRRTAQAERHNRAKPAYSQGVGFDAEAFDQDLMALMEDGIKLARDLISDARTMRHAVERPSDLKEIAMTLKQMVEVGEKIKETSLFYRPNALSVSEQRHLELVKEAIRQIADKDQPHVTPKVAAMWLQGEGVPDSMWSQIAKLAELEHNDELRALIQELGAERSNQPTLCEAEEEE